MIKLAIISHTKHYQNTNGEIVGWEPTIREINQFPTIFDLVYHVAPLYPENPHEANAPYTSDRIKYIPIRPIGGSGILRKLEILLHMPFILFQIIKIINKADWIHFRAPTNLGIFVLPLLTLYRSKKKWIKYAGNWAQKEVPLSYSAQRWWLKENINQSIVTINGYWENQKPHLLSFHNPCLNNEELYQAAEIGSKKIFSGKLKLCFVGRIDSNKGINNFIRALGSLDTLNIIEEVNIAGGIEDNLFGLESNPNKIQINFLGWVNRNKLNQIYSKSHIIILPTQSEGFPKVIAESAAYGCVPVVTNISPINQYINHGENGLLLDNIHIKTIKECLINIDGGAFNLKYISTATIKMASKFTYNNFINRIQSEIIDA